MTAAAARSQTSSEARVGALLVLCGALFLDALDVSMIGVALPSIRTDLHIDELAAMGRQRLVLGTGGFLLLGGRAADLLSGGGCSLISLGVFVVASAFGGFATAAPSSRRAS